MYRYESLWKAKGTVSVMAKQFFMCMVFGHPSQDAGSENVGESMSVIHSCWPW